MIEHRSWMAELPSRPRPRRSSAARPGTLVGSARRVPLRRLSSSRALAAACLLPCALAARSASRSRLRGRVDDRRPGLRGRGPLGRHEHRAAAAPSDAGARRLQPPGRLRPRRGRLLGDRAAPARRGLRDEWPPRRRAAGRRDRLQRRWRLALHPGAARGAPRSDVRVRRRAERRQRVARLPGRPPVRERRARGGGRSTARSSG